MKREGDELPDIVCGKVYVENEETLGEAPESEGGERKTLRPWSTPRKRIRLV